MGYGCPGAEGTGAWVAGDRGDRGRGGRGRRGAGLGRVRALVAEGYWWEGVREGRQDREWEGIRSW